MKRKPFVRVQYEPEDVITTNYSESGVESGAKIDVFRIEDRDARKFILSTKDMSLRQKLVWINHHKSEFAPTTHVVDVIVSDDQKLEVSLRHHKQQMSIFLTRAMHNTYHLDRCLSLANESMDMGGYLFCHARTTALKRQVLLSKYPSLIGRFVYALHYIWHRVFPKLQLTKKLYFLVTGGSNRSFSRVELLGRLYHAGFEVQHEEFSNGELFIVARKVRKPIYGDHPSISPIIKLSRVGKDGKLINVYKFRTMFSYSEYLQPYVYKYQNLASGGKFADDYRVNGWGKLLRATWLDEFPMFINLFKGQMKLVGVRPLSRHYYSLYSPEMQQLRIKTKPGLLPPFYYESEPPETIEEIQASERRYIEAYLKHPLLTDWRYFWGIVRNIVFKHRKSK